MNHPHSSGSSAPPSRHGGAREFPDTSWTVLREAARPDAVGAKAREELWRRYGRAICGFVAILINDASRADEIATDFYVEKFPGLVARADAGKGTFRSYLKQALRNFVRDIIRAERRQPHIVLGWETDAAEDAADAGTDMRAAERALDLRYVRGVLERALLRAEHSCRRAGTARHLRLFVAYHMAVEPEGPTWEQVGARGGVTSREARHLSETGARHFARAIREELAKDLVDPTEAAVDREVAELLASLGD